MLQGLVVLPRNPKPTSLTPVTVCIRRSIRCSVSSPSRSPETFDVAAVAGDLSARERRQLKSERREKKAAVSGNWREEVEVLLARRRKKEYSNWKEKLNLDNLAMLGPRWWTVRISRVNGEEIADRLSRALARGFPDMEFKVYFPSIREKSMLKNGSYSEKVKSLYPGCLFLHCILNKEVHDYIRECYGIGGFLGAKVGNTKRQINKPKPVSFEEMEKMFQEAKEHQQKFDQSFEKEQQEQNISSYADSRTPNSKRVKNADLTNTENYLGVNLELHENTALPGKNIEYLAPGATVRILSGPFAEFTGRVKYLDHSNNKATIGFTLFGKECFQDLEVEQIVAVMT